MTGIKKIFFDGDVYTIKVTDGKVICQGYGMEPHFNHESKEWENFQTIATTEDPLLYLTTNNLNERILRQLLPNLKGAKKIKEIKKPNWDEDPYGRRFQRGTIIKQIWDLSGCFGKEANCKPHKLSDVELYEFAYC